MSTIAVSRQLWKTCAYPNERRHQPRVTLIVKLRVKGKDNLFFVREVKTINVSRNGACLIMDEELAVGSIIGVSAFKGKFIASAQITSVKPNLDGGWKIGLNFLESKGKWIII